MPLRATHFPAAGQMTFATGEMKTATLAVPHRRSPGSEPPAKHTPSACRSAGKVTHARPSAPETAVSLVECTPVIPF